MGRRLLQTQALLVTPVALSAGRNPTSPRSLSSFTFSTHHFVIFNCFLKEEEDICPDCYASDKKMYAGAEHQKFGEPIPVVSKKGKREAPETNGVAKKSKADE